MRDIVELREAMSDPDAQFSRDEVVALLDFETMRIQQEQISITQMEISRAKADMARDAMTKRMEDRAARRAVRASE